MATDLNDFAPAAFSVPQAVQYSALTRSFMYANRHRLDWRKAGRRSIIMRESLDRLLAELPRANTVVEKRSSRRP
jgi:hypothetical protein